MTSSWMRIASVIARATGFRAAYNLAQRRLLGWYLRELEKAEIAELPKERIVSYPLA